MYHAVLAEGILYLFAARGSLQIISRADFSSKRLMRKRKPKVCGTQDIITKLYVEHFMLFINKYRWLCKQHIADDWLANNSYCIDKD